MVWLQGAPSSGGDLPSATDQKGNITRHSSGHCNLPVAFALAPCFAGVLPGGHLDQHKAASISATHDAKLHHNMYMLCCSNCFSCSSCNEPSIPDSISVSLRGSVYFFSSTSLCVWQDGCNPD